jgi:hypothetical protein
MLFQNLFLVFALSSFGLAQNNNNDDVPAQCQEVCSNVVSNENRCETENGDYPFTQYSYRTVGLTSYTDDNRTGYLDCICKTQNANVDIPICAACVSQFDDDGNDNGMSDFLHSYLMCFFALLCWSE